MRDQGRLPPTASLLGPGRFFGAAPARAYTAAGSFLRFLLDRHGGAAVLAAYGAGDVSRGLGRPLAELDGEWQRFLDGVEVAPRLAAAAESRFSRGSLFERACAREIAVLERDAASPRLAPQERERAARRASQLAGGDPAYLRAAVEAWRRSDAGRATAVAGEALARAEAVGARGTLRAALHTALGDLRLGAGDPAAAAAHFHAALALHPGSAESRTLRAKLALAENPALRDALAPSLLGLGDAGARSSALAASDAPLARYLLARVRLARGAPGLALATLSGVDAAALPDESFRREAARMRAEALCKLGRWEEGIAAWRAAAAQSVDDGARQQAQDAAARCSFERDVYGRPVPWEGDS
jgi:predicted negative regulator of RcsB-dependent stress response